MNPWTDLLFLTVVVVFIVDLSGFTESWLDALSRWLGHPVVPSRLRPFTCSLCMVWWSGVVYALATGRFCLPILAYIAALSFLSFPISQIMIFINEAILKLTTVWRKKIS